MFIFAPTLGKILQARNLRFRFLEEITKIKKFNSTAFVGSVIYITSNNKRGTEKIQHRCHGQREHLHVLKLFFYSWIKSKRSEGFDRKHRQKTSFEDPRSYRHSKSPIYTNHFKKIVQRRFSNKIKNKGIIYLFHQLRIIKKVKKTLSGLVATTIRCS